MQFDSLAALIAMDGHGPYVWSAYAIALITLVALIVAPWRRTLRFFAEQRGIEQRREQRVGRSQPASTPSASDTQAP